jgi:O-methyltransferase
MSRRLNSLINGLLSPLGVQLHRKRVESAASPQSHDKLWEAADATEKLARATIFPGLPRREGRQELITQLQGTQLLEALHLIWHLNRTLSLEGDVCELGIAQGATSALIANEIRETSKNLWLFDSFEGLSKPTDRDELIDDVFSLGSIERYKGTMACAPKQVIDRLDSIQFPSERVKIVPGFIEKTAKMDNLPKKVCFAYVDFDLYGPIKIALELLDSKLPIGGTVIVDDYGFFSTGVQAAVDEFAEARGQQYIKTPSADWAGHFCVLQRI